LEMQAYGEKGKGKRKEKKKVLVGVVKQRGLRDALE